MCWVLINLLLNCISVLCKASRYAQPWVVAIKKTIIIIIIIIIFEVDGLHSSKRSLTSVEWWSQGIPSQVIEQGLMINDHLNKYSPCTEQQTRVLKSTH